MYRYFLLFFFTFSLLFFFVEDSNSQQAVRGDLNATHKVVTNEVDPLADYHWDRYSKVLWKTVYSNGYIEVHAVTNVNFIKGRK